MNELFFRPLGEDDLDQLMELERLSFSHPWSADAYLAELRDNRLARYYGAFGETGRLAAFAGFWLIEDEAHITNVAVRPELRNQGLGQWLMLRLAVEAMRQGADKMTLEVRQSNASAIALYEKLGFVQLGCRRGYYDDPKEDALILWWQLPTEANTGK